MNKKGLLGFSYLDFWAMLIIASSFIVFFLIFSFTGNTEVKNIKFLAGGYDKNILLENILKTQDNGISIGELIMLGEKDEDYRIIAREKLGKILENLQIEDNVVIWEYQDGRADKIPKGANIITRIEIPSIHDKVIKIELWRLKT